MTAPAPLDLTALLDDLERAHAEGSRTPWSLLGGTHDRDVIDDHGCHVATSGTFPDAALIVAAVNHLPTLIAALRAVAELAEQFEAEAEVREVRATTYPPSGPWAIDHNRLVVRADTFRRSAARIRSAITAALSPESVQS